MKKVLVVFSTIIAIIISSCGPSHSSIIEKINKHEDLTYKEENSIIKYFESAMDLCAENQTKPGQLGIKGSRVLNEKFPFMHKYCRYLGSNYLSDHIKAEWEKSVKKQCELDRDNIFDSPMYEIMLSEDRDIMDFEIDIIANYVYEALIEGYLNSKKFDSIDQKFYYFKSIPNRQSFFPNIHEAYWKGVNRYKNS